MEAEGAGSKRAKGEGVGAPGRTVETRHSPANAATVPVLRASRTGVLRAHEHGYESFTDSCVSADMTPGGRIPRLWACCRPRRNGITPDMTSTTECRR